MPRPRLGLRRPPPTRPRLHRPRPYGTRNTASPVLRAGLHALDARFAALLGQPRDALRAVHRAQEIFTEDNPDPTPAFVSCLDEAELSSTLGEVLLFLARKPTPHSTRSMPSACSPSAADHRAEHRVRSRAFDAIALARAQLFIGQFEAAHTTAEQAAVIGTGLDSARVRRRYRDLTHEPGQEGRRLTEVAADVSDSLRGIN